MTTYEELCTRLQVRKNYYLGLAPGDKHKEDRYRRLARTAECFKRKIECRKGIIDNGLVGITLPPQDVSHIGARGSTLETNVRIIGREVNVKFVLKR